MSKTEYRIIRYNSPEYQQSLNLRYQLLRKPLGRVISKEDVATDKESTHYGAFYKGKLIGTGKLEKETDEVFWVRQIAVDNAFQGKGVGKELMASLEQEAVKQGCKRLLLHARATAVDFYRKLGYYTTSSEYAVMSIPHFDMEKTL